MSRGALTWFEPFGVTVWKLLITESFFQSKLNEFETKIFIGIWGRSWYCLLESAWQVRFNKVYFTIFRAKVCKILILSGFLLSNAVPEGTEQGMKSLVEDHVSLDRPGFLTD
jgi:hypothetical protein